MKTCTKCGEEKSLSEYAKRAASADGHKSMCKACCKVYQAARYRANADAVKAKRKEYREQNGEKIAEYMKGYRERNREQISEYYSEYKRERSKKDKAFAARMAARKEVHRAVDFDRLPED